MGLTGGETNACARGQAAHQIGRVSAQQRYGDSVGADKGEQDEQAMADHASSVRWRVKHGGW